MAKTTDGRPIAIVTRQAINWRIPFDLVEGIDKYRRQTGQDRTAVVVEALEAHLARRAARGRRRRR